MNKIEKLQQFKENDNFLIEKWRKRALNPSPRTVIDGMNQEVDKFIVFLQNQMNNPNSNEQINKIQLYFNDWHPIDYDTEETEFVADIMFEILETIEVETNNLFIY